MYVCLLCLSPAVHINEEEFDSDDEHHSDLVKSHETRIHQPGDGQAGPSGLNTSYDKSG